MERITIKHLRRDVFLLNHAAGKSNSPRVKDAQGQSRANVGTFFVIRMHGSYQLARMANKSGGFDEVSPGGTAREVHNFIRAMLAGFDLAQEVKA